MTKKHYISIAICSLIILIAAAIFGYYYKEYIAPESYVIGTNKDGVYKDLAFADYYTDDEILFSQNINKSSFSIENGVACYEFNFEHKDFNGVKKDYILYVNDYMVNNVTTDAGTISGTYVLNYYDVDKSTLCHSNIDINFSFYSLSSKLQVSLPEQDLGYLVKFFKTDNFIITLANNPFLMQDKEGEVDEKIDEITQLTNKVENLEFQVKYYKELLELYKTEQTMSVAFRVLNDTHNIQLVKVGDTSILPTEPEVDGYKFLGWSLDGSTIVDVETVPITEETVFVAVLEKLTVVTFMNGTDICTTKYVENGSVIPAVTAIKEGCEFYGWSLDRSLETKIDKDYVITKDITVYALYGKYVEVQSSAPFVQYATVNYSNIFNYLTSYKNIDLTKSTINFRMVSWEGTRDGNMPIVATFNGDNLGETVTINGSNISWTDYRTTGTMTISLNADGSINMNLGNFALYYKSGSTGGAEAYCITLGPSQIFVIE